MTWEIKAEGMDYHSPYAEVYPKVDGETYYPNYHSIIESDNETVMIAVYQQKRLISRMSKSAKDLTEKMIKEKMVSFGADADYLIEGHESKIICYVSEDELGRTRLELAPGHEKQEHKVKVNEEEVDGKAELNINDIIEIGGLPEPYVSFDALVLKAVNTHICKKFSEDEKDNSGLCIAIARANKDGKVSITYTGDLINIYTLDKKNNLTHLNEGETLEYIGKREITPFTKELSLRENPAFFLCSKTYQEFVGSEAEEKIRDALASYKSFSDLEDAVKDAITYGIPHPLKTTKSKLDTEYSLALMMSHKEGLNLKELIRNPLIKTSAIGAAIGLVGIIALLSIGYAIKKSRTPDKQPPIEIAKVPLELEAPVLEPPEVVELPEPPVKPEVKLEEQPLINPVNVEEKIEQDIKGLPEGFEKPPQQFFIVEKPKEEEPNNEVVELVQKVIKKVDETLEMSIVPEDEPKKITSQELTEKMISETLEIIKTGDYQKALDALEQFEKHSKIDVMPAVVLVKELPGLEAELAKFPSNTLEAKELGDEVSYKKQKLDSICTNIFNAAQELLKARN